MVLPKESNRLIVVDALRGFSIVAIMLLHNIEHFDVYHQATNIPKWMLPLDKGIWDTLFFLFGGKVYAIFALLFGLTFYIQDTNQQKNGKEFRIRFMWRMLLLLGFGILNSMFYQGDILSIYAMVGLFILPFAKLKNKHLFLVALFFMLQPFEWIKIIQALSNPEMELSNPKSWTYFGKMWDYIAKDSFINTMIGNLTNGKKAVLHWSWENGRYFQTLSLFLFGILSGRKQLFKSSKENNKFWLKTLFVSVTLWLVFFFVNNNLGTWIESKAVLRPIQTIERSWLNMAFMMIIVSGFVLLFQTKFKKGLNVLAPIGRMSLSNYIIQSMIGSFIYYGYGLSLYAKTGATYCLFIGIGLAIIQGVFCTEWLKRHKYGPFEFLWHKATWIQFKTTQS